MKGRLYVNMGIAFEHNGQMLKALECYEDATAAIPTSARSWKLKGSALLHFGEYMQAVESLQRALNLVGKAPQLKADALCDLGSAHVCILLNCAYCWDAR